MYEPLLSSIRKYIPLNEGDIEIVKSLFKLQTLRGGTVLVNCGDVSERAFFINSGYLRYYKFVQEAEQTIHLFGPGDFGASFCGFISGEKSDEILEAVTDSEVLYIEKSSLELLYNSDNKWQFFGRRLMEDMLVIKEKRLIDQISLSAEQRYIKLLEGNPLLIQSVPVQYIASYIGIQPESLSRIRRKIFS